MSEERALYKPSESIGAVVERVMFRNVPADQRNVALAICQRYELDPILKHVVIISGNAYITRDGLLHIAHRSGVRFSVQFAEPVVKANPYRKQDDIYLAGTLHRAGCPDWTAGLWFSEYAATGGAWKTHPAAMHQKVVEAYLLRRGFNVSLTAAEEMGYSDDADVVDADVVMPEPEAAPSPTPPQPHKNGDPLAPDALLASIRKVEALYAEQYGDALIDTESMKRVAGALGKLVGDANRPVLLKRIANVDSTKDLRRCTGAAILRWLGIEKSGYVATRPQAQAEADALLADRPDGWEQEAAE